MNLIWSRVLRSTYRREPVVSFVATAGTVAAAIGGLGEQWSLVTVGLGTVSVVIAWRWGQQRRKTHPLSERMPIYVLPSHSSRPRLPTLNLPRQKPSSSKR